MPEYNNKKLQVFLPVIISVSIAFGILISVFLLQKPAENIISRDISNNKLNAIINYVEAQYVDEVNHKELEELAIPKFLEALDPHTTYSSPEETKLMEERVFREIYPSAYAYLETKKDVLAERDKGKGEYENWYAFGRTQSLEKVQNKLFFPKMSDRPPHCIINSDENLLFYNGQAIIGHNKEEMVLIKKIMESRLFWYYIKTTSKPYSSEYYSLNGNYINNFGICELTETEREFFLGEDDRSALDSFLERKYRIQIT